MMIDWIVNFSDQFLSMHAKPDIGHDDRHEILGVNIQ